MNTVNDWKRQYAIRMPDGELYSRAFQVKMTDAEIQAQKTAEEASEDLTAPSVLRDMNSYQSTYQEIFGAPTASVHVKTVRLPLIFDTREEAESLFADLADHAAQFGVSFWGGRVVERLCTPFTSNDPAQQFGNEIVRWMLDIPEEKR